MINISDSIYITSLAKAVRDNSEPEVKGKRYNHRFTGKSFVGNVQQIKENGIQWYRKRFRKNECCGTHETVTEGNHRFCEECGFLMG